METTTRFLTADDANSMLNLYCEIAAHPGGFARAAEEISPHYIEKLLHGVMNGGLGIGACDSTTNELVGFIVARKPGPKVFDHVLTDLTIGIAPSHQSHGIGRKLFLDFIEHIQEQRPDVLRIELLARESNQQSIAFYESVGFRAEGSLEKRIRNSDGSFETDIPMGWLKAE